MMQIHTVAAGGGSICRFDGMRFRVGPGKRGREPGPGLLPQRRAADRHRLQPVPWPDRPGAFPGRVRAGRRPAARPATRRELGCRKSPTQLGEQEPRGNRRGLSRDRGRQYGRCDPQDLDRARPRRDALHARLLRRGGGPACVRGRRRARHGADPDPSARRRAVGLRHRHRRREGDPGDELAEAARRGFFARRWPSSSSARATR